METSHSEAPTRPNSPVVDDDTDTDMQTVEERPFCVMCRKEFFKCPHGKDAKKRQREEEKASKKRKRSEEATQDKPEKKKRAKVEKKEVVLVEDGKALPQEWKTDSLENLAFCVTVRGGVGVGGCRWADSRRVDFPRSISVHPKYMKLAEKILALLREGRTCQAKMVRFWGERHMNTLVLLFGRTVQEDLAHLPEWTRKREEEKAAQELRNKRQNIQANFPSMPWCPTFDTIMEVYNTNKMDVVAMEAQIAALMTPQERERLEALKKAALFGALHHATKTWR